MVARLKDLIIINQEMIMVSLNSLIDNYNLFV